MKSRKTIVRSADATDSHNDRTPEGGRTAPDSCTSWLFGFSTVCAYYTADNLSDSQAKGTAGYLHSSYPTNNFDKRADGFYKAIRKSGMSVSDPLFTT